jgi:mannose-6-phosphate isomerase-like protein (cupin superfamily)
MEGSMKSTEFAEFIRALPEADLPFPGLHGWLLQSELGQVLFMEAHVDVIVPEHSHGDQWGIVVDGRIDLTIGHDAHTFTSGDSYFIPKGTSHQAHIHAGFRAIDVFADRDRYRARAAGR